MNKSELEEWVAQEVANEIQREIDKNLLTQLFSSMKPIRIVWKEYNHAPMVLYANLGYDHGTVTQTGLREEHLIPVQEWCEQSKCGRRISFDMFKFKDRKEITAFLLRWG